MFYIFIKYFILNGIMNFIGMGFLRKQNSLLHLKKNFGSFIQRNAGNEFERKFYIFVNSNMVI